MAEAEAPATRQLVIAYDRDDELIVYATAYGSWDIDDPIEDCRAKYGHAKLIDAADLPKPD